MCVFLVLDIQPHVHGRMDGGVYLSNSRGTFFLKKKELGSSLPDGVASPETNPLRDGTVLLLSFGKLLLGAERLVARHLEGLSRWRASIWTWSGGDVVERRPTRSPFRMVIFVWVIRA